MTDRNNTIEGVQDIAWILRRLNMFNRFDDFLYFRSALLRYHLDKRYGKEVKHET